MSNSVIVKMVGNKIVVEVDILKAIAEGVGGSKPVTTAVSTGESTGKAKPGPKPKDTSATAS